MKNKKETHLSYFEEKIKKRMAILGYLGIVLVIQTYQNRSVNTIFETETNKFQIKISVKLVNLNRKNSTKITDLRGSMSN